MVATLPTVAHGENKTVEAQYWVICIEQGLMGFAYASQFSDVQELAHSMLKFLEMPPQPVFIYPIGPRLFVTKNKIETGDC